MKKIIASAGLAALGAASLQAAYAPGLSPMEKSKPWTISAILRGFYDDNPTDSIRSQKQESWGLEISPSLAINIALDQTLIGFSYVYDLRFYEARPSNDADHSHQVSLKINHAFNERIKLDVSDAFHSAQEPELESGIVTIPLRTQQNYIHNNGRLALNAELTPILGLEVAYQNDYWDYDQEGAGSLSAILDRTEHLGSITARWQVEPGTVGLLGYRYGVVDHNSKDSLNQNNAPPPLGAGYTNPNTRDQNSHFVFVGVDNNFTSQFNALIRVGAQFTDYPNAEPGQDDSTVSPWLDASATWTYNPGSYLQLGVKHERNQTDVAFSRSSTSAQDQESTAVYGVVNHRITPKLTGSLLGQYQHSAFRGGGVDGEVDQLGTIGANLSYQVNTFVSAEMGYNYDRLDSDLAFRSFTRNRIYFGVRATY